jgi:hypothetical protein
MPAIFISHSSLDQKISDDIRGSLAKLGFEQVFLDFDKDSGIGAGENWERRLYEELTRCHAVILVLTPSWLASTWCRIELAQARALGKVILPVICAPLGERYVLPEVQAVDLVGWDDGGIERLAQRSTPSPASSPAVSGCIPTARPIRDPCLRGRGRRDLFRTRRGNPRRGRAARCAARRAAPACCSSSARRARAIVAAARRRAAAGPRRRRDWLALPPIRPEKAPLETIAGDRRAARQAGRLARLA